MLSFCFDFCAYSVRQRINYLLLLVAEQLGHMLEDGRTLPAVLVGLRQVVVLIQQSAVALSA